MSLVVALQLKCVFPTWGIYCQLENEKFLVKAHMN
jgi:hypothetical protein